MRRPPRGRVRGSGPVRGESSISGRFDRMSDQHLAARVRAALDAGEGLLRLAPTWVPRSFLMPGGRLKLARQDLYALGTHRGGIDERWFASTTAAANEGAPDDEGLSYVVHDGEPLHAAGRHRAARPRDDRGDDLGQVQEVAGLHQVLRQHGPDPPPHAPDRPSRPRSVGQRRQAGELLLPAAAQRDGQQLPLHLLGPGAGHDQGAGPPLPGALEQGRQRHPRPLARPTASSPAPAG